MKKTLGIITLIRQPLGKLAWKLINYFKKLTRGLKNNCLNLKHCLEVAELVLEKALEIKNSSFEQNDQERKKIPFP